MRINSVTGFNSSSYKNNSNKNTSFKGATHPRLVRFEKESDVQTKFSEDDFRVFGRQGFYQGAIPLRRVPTSYEPDIIMKGDVYYADWGEWVGDWARETHSAVIADRARARLTMDRIKDCEKDTPDEMLMMQSCLKKDIEHHEKVLFRLHNRTLLTDDARRETQRRIQKRTARLNQLREMEAVSKNNFQTTIDYLKAHNYDYFAEKAKERRRGRMSTVY